VSNLLAKTRFWDNLMILHANIDRRAAAIECYPDLADSRKPAQVVSTDYKKELDAYHGALEHKEG
jgi:hypothetical protein